MLLEQWQRLIPAQVGADQELVLAQQLVEAAVLVNMLSS